MASTRSPVIGSGATAAHAQTHTVTALETLLTAQEVAAWLGVSTRWVLAHAAVLNRPVLPSVKLGKAVRFERGAVTEFIRACARFDGQHTP